ncbi:unnamed protein product [Blepharisma stoltei]|uniref:EGF-like domain-containing protein n=1 Tax=Blepharisma stoltei TaxID=1481888 RepID=A0AAU9JTX5_9CILI|nr:unnamed protein product [Blepharisma stoltei]
MLARFICLLVLTLLTSSTKEINPDVKTSSKGTKIDSKLLLQDPNLPIQLFQDAMNSRKLKENSTSDASGNKNKRQLYSWCIDGQNGCQECNESRTLCSICKNVGDMPDRNGGCTTSSLPGCSIVTGEFECDVCSANHYFSCSQCSDSIANCNVCFNLEQCSECIEGFYLDGSRCTLCSSKYNDCEACNWDVCQKCKSGFALDANSNCVSSPTSNCISVDNGDCYDCAEGYYLKDNACISCTGISNCELCDDESTCTQCSAGFFLQDPTTCVSCSSQISYCAACDSDSECTECDSTHYLTDLDDCANSGPEHCYIVDSNDLTTCNDCLKGYNWDQSDKTCKACGDIMPHCTECQDGNIEDFRCWTCDVGYILDIYSVCIKSPLKNCVKVSDASHCEVCSSVSNGVCASAGAPIANCKMASTDSSYCAECDLGYSYTGEGLCQCSAKDCTTCNTNDGSICDTCIDNYYEDCVPCSTKIANCDTCAGGVCTKCSAGYFLLYSTCNLCALLDPNCITCADNELFCTSCKPGFLAAYYGECVESSLLNCEIAQGSTSCTLCLSGYYINDQQTCSSCEDNSAGCVACSESSTCLKCSQGYWLDSLSCSPCSSIPNCQACDNGTICTKCQATYLLNENKSCTSSSIENCDVVVSNDPSTCQQCSTGYFWDTTICKACSVPLPNCDTCSSSTTCSLCKTGYYWNLIQCSVCTNALKNCLECSSDGTSCSKCDSGYYLNHENKCTSSVLNSCAKVSDDGTCISCPSNKIFACTNGGTSLPNCAVSSSDSSVCVKCMPSYKNQGGICVEMCSENCSDCSSKNICTVCNSGYFLYDSNGKTTCISCADSCTDCEPNPNCFMCADLVVQDGDTCRVDSVGYEISFSDRFIIIDFAHSSSKILTLASIEAFTIDGQNIATTNWLISSRSDTQLQIQTDNVREADLPINIDLSLL